MRLARLFARLALRRGPPLTGVGLATFAFRTLAAATTTAVWSALLVVAMGQTADAFEIDTLGFVTATSATAAAAIFATVFVEAA